MRLWTIPYSSWGQATVFATDWSAPSQWVVKVIDPLKEEADILENLQQDLAHPKNHVIPCQVLRSDRVLAIMPRLECVEILFRHKLSSMLKAIEQILEVGKHQLCGETS